MRSFAARLGAFLPAILAALIAGGCMGNLFRRGDLAEAPPKAYRGLPLAPGFKRVDLPTLEAVDAYCKAHGMTPAQRNGIIEACLLDYDREMVLPTLEALGGDRKRLGALEEHEIAHSYGLTHGKGQRGWVKDPSFFAKNGHIVDLSMVGKVPPLQMRNNPANVFAGPMPATNGNIFRER